MKCEKHYVKPKWQDRKNTNPYSAWYSDRRWRVIRKRHLLREPFCKECGNIATVVDHIKPHEGDWGLFIDPTNLQSLCVICHNRKTAREDGAFGNKKK
jgi:5-methylcytosine-specific restriction protein A